MKHLLLLILLLQFLPCMEAPGAGLQAQTTMREVFAHMPDSIIPVLRANDRLDMIDFLDAQMPAEVNNRLSSTSELLALSSDSLTLRLSDALLVRMRLLSTTQHYDSLQQVIHLERIYTLSADSLSESVSDFYTLRWRRLSALAPADQHLVPPASPNTLLRRDDDIFAPLYQ